MDRFYNEEYMIIDLKYLIDKYKLKIDGIIHIGAHYGQEHMIYRQLGINKIIYFEPIKSNFDILAKNINDEAIIVNTAVGSYTGVCTMFVDTTNNGMSSSVLEPKVHLKMFPNVIFGSREKVPIITLNDYFNTQNIQNIYNMINIDVQGYELEVFKGATNILHSINYIYTEINNDELYKDCVLIDELDKFLINYNFIRRETNWAGGNWGDALYIKN